MHWSKFRCIKQNILLTADYLKWIIDKNVIVYVLKDEGVIF